MNKDSKACCRCLGFL